MNVLSNMVGVSRQSISLYEKGVQTPGPEVRDRLCACLAVPARYFQREPLKADGPAFFRKVSATTKTACTRARIELRWSREVAEVLDELVELPRVDLPDLGISDPTTLRMTDVDALAGEVRQAWGLGDGPISNVVWLLERQGILVARTTLDVEGFDGVSEWIAGRPCILLATDASGPRARFNAAHELAHLLLHRSVTAEQLRRVGMHAQLELQAHRFAGAFTFPEKSFLREARPVSLETFRDLKLRWRLSIAMMVKRARAVELIDESQDREFMKQMGYRRWRRTEPYDDRVPAEVPRLLTNAVDAILEAGAATPSDLVHAAALGESDFARAASLARGRLAVEPVAFMPSAFSVRDRTVPGGSGRVLTFPRGPRP